MKRVFNRSKKEKNMKFGNFLDNAYYKHFDVRPIRCFLASILWNWGGLAIFSFLLVGIACIASGKNPLRPMGIFAMIVGAGNISYPFVGAILKGADDSYGYSIGFSYGTLALFTLISKMKLASNGLALFFGAVISAVVCCIFRNKQ